MDTKTPPIPQKHHERPQPKRQERVDVSLPPLTPIPNHRQRSKTPGTTWSRGPPPVTRPLDQERERPYRVLHIGATPLMHACQQADRARVLRLLKEQRETIGYRDRTLRSALHYCMDAGTGGAVAAAAPELVNAPDAEGHTPLHLAVIAGDTQLVAVLLANGADVNAKDLEGHSVLHWATVCGEAECVRLILASGARPSTPDLRGGSPLHYAAQCCGAAATAELSVPRKVGLKVLQTLLEFGADVNAKDEDGRQPILWAASAGSAEAVLALARAGGAAAVGASDKDGLTALHCAASRGHARCIEALVNFCGSQPDHVDDNGCSALHYAATLGHADATALLLKLGADPNRQDRKGRTPALCAAAKGQLETLKILAQHGGSLHARTVRGTGVAHEAVASGRIELVKWLAKKRPGILDVATHDGRTPLHVAALHGYLDMCKVLLDHGARINAVLRTSKGVFMTALDAALFRGHRDCAKLIQMHGGSTAQHLRTQKTAPSKVFAAKLHMKRVESSSESEGSPKQHRRGLAEPELYYEERWIERRIRKRGSTRKVARRDSKSFSEEEIRLSKTSKRNHERRTRSESARYESGDDSEEKPRRRKSKKRSTKRKHEYSEFSSPSDDQRDQNREKRGSEKDGKVSSSDMKKDVDGKDEDAIDSLSDDSLEVVVVKKSSEKTEKMVAGTKSKTPRGSLKEARKSCRRGKSTKRKGSIEGSDDDLKTEAPDLGKKSSGLNSKIRDATSMKDRFRYQKDVTDSTSQETVERVTVTAMVHRDQAPDSPSLTAKRSVEENQTQAHEEVTHKTETPTRQEGTTPTSGRTSLSEKMRTPTTSNKIDEILEKADEMHKALITKAADLKKEFDGKRNRTSDGSGEEEKVDKEDDRTKSREIDSLEESESESTSEDSQMGYSRLHSRTDERSSEKTEQDSLKEATDKDSIKTSKEDEGQKSETPHSESTEAEQPSKEHKQEIQREGVDTPRTAVEDVVPSDPEEEVKEEAKSVKVRTISFEDEKEKSELRTKEILGTSPDNSSPKILDEDTKDESKSIGKSKDKEESVASARTSKASGAKIEIESKEPEGGKIGSKMEKTEDLKEIKKSALKTESDTRKNGKEIPEESKSIPGTENFPYIDESIPSSPKSAKPSGRARPTTGKHKTAGKSSLKAHKIDRSPDRKAIVAVIDSPEWEDDDDEVSKEIQKVIDEDVERDSEPEDNEMGIIRVLPSTSEEETPRTGVEFSRTSGIESLPQVHARPRARLLGAQSPRNDRHRIRGKQRRDSGGRDSGIEPSPRISRIPRRTPKCCPITERQQALNMDNVTRDVQVSLRRYHLERKIFFQLMELKRLQIRHGRANEQVLVKRQVDVFHKAGTAGPMLGVTKYDQPYTFRHFETFLYEQLRRLQRRPATPDWCTEAKQCTQKTHRCHHATSAYTAVPVYTYRRLSESFRIIIAVGGGAPERAGRLPKIESRGRGQMTVEVTHGEEKQVIALPAERLDRTKRYFVTFTVRGEAQDSDKPKSTFDAQRNAKSV
ncbi:ankycorbin [Orussus abietinus]|uniref:ankycorbin n=1 Tax=Orussus abietinus TaxID=222816 RepID=UPI000C715E3B|nr:ankycorbin [Orussus abietinus]